MSNKNPNNSTQSVEVKPKASVQMVSVDDLNEFDTQNSDLLSRAVGGATIVKGDNFSIKADMMPSKEKILRNPDEKDDSKKVYNYYIGIPTTKGTLSFRVFNNLGCKTTSDLYQKYAGKNLHVEDITETIGGRAPELFKVKNYTIKEVGAI